MTDMTFLCMNNEYTLMGQKILCSGQICTMYLLCSTTVECECLAHRKAAIADGLTNLALSREKYHI